MIETDRLILRQWKNKDLEPFAEMNADPEVMRYFPSTHTPEQSNVMAKKCYDLIGEREHGWGLWAVELQETGEFIGFTGLHIPSPQLSFFPCIEIGWRLRKQFWRKGYATEAAEASLWFAFEVLFFPEIVSFTSVINEPSVGVMKKLGMKDQQKNFMHPLVPKGHVLEEHVLYAIRQEEWLTQNRNKNE